MAISFKEFLEEDAAADVAKLQSDIAQIDVAIQQRTSSLTSRRIQLQKQLMLKQKQAQAEANSKGQQPQGQQPQGQQPLQ